MAVTGTEQETSLFELKEFLLSVIANAPYGILALDLEGEIIMANTLAVEYLGKNMSVNRAIGKNILELIKDVPPLTKIVETNIKRGRKPFTVPSIQINKRFMLIKGRLILDGTIFVIEDITDQKKIEGKLREQTQKLEKANIRLKEFDRLKSMFLASMSHELRTPLNSIIGFTGIILQGISGEITEDQRKELTMVKNSAIHLLDLINDVIDVSKIETNKVELFISDFNLSDIVKELRDSFASAVEEKGLKISLKTPKRMVIKSDKRRVKQVIINYISNAVKFTDRGEVEIKVVKKDGKAEVSVRDTGIGIEKKNMDKLFEAFSRIRTVGVLREGSGLGLYLTRKISDLLGGKVSAESEFGKGSKFTFTLPSEYKEAKND